MSPDQAAPAYRVRRFPRVSGDEPVARLAAITRYGFSPRERG